MASAAARGGIAPEASRAAPLRLRLRASAASPSPRGAPRRSCCRPARLRAAACASGLFTGRVGVGVAAAEAPTCSAVYKVYCQAGALQYVGLTRNVRATLAAHAAELPPAVCCEAEWEVLGGAGATRGALVAAWKRALAEHLAAGGALPAGNAKGAPRCAARAPRCRTAEHRRPSSDNADRRPSSDNADRRPSSDNATRRRMGWGGIWGRLEGGGARQRCCAASRRRGNALSLRA